MSSAEVEKPKPSLLKQAALQIVAGGSAGFVEVCIMHPLDLIKTRLQIQNKKTTGNANQVIEQIHFQKIDQITRFIPLFFFFIVDILQRCY